MKIYTIYKAVCLINNKSYVGFDDKWPKRKKVHLVNSVKIDAPDYNVVFHKAIRKYGKDTFSWEVIMQTEDGYWALNCMEGYYIRKLNSHYLEGYGYNMTYGGEGSLGRICREETRAKLSESMKKKYEEDINYKQRVRTGTKKGMENWWASLDKDQQIEYKNKLREKSKGNKRALGKHWELTDITKQKMSISRTGKIFTNETKQKISESMKGKLSGVNNPMANEEYRNKQRLGCIGRKRQYRENGTWFWIREN